MYAQAPIAERGAVYHGVDIAPTPVAMMQHRLRMRGDQWVEQRIGIGSAHAIPFPDDSFDYVFSIGCLHHTGSIEDASRRSVASSSRAGRPS
jgi:ubiquinone/menaquinone biosynthesis C-methylase UbiE